MLVMQHSICPNVHFPIQQSGGFGCTVPHPECTAPTTGLSGGAGRVTLRLHCTALHYTALHCTALHCGQGVTGHGDVEIPDPRPRALHFIAYTALHTLHCTHCIHCTAHTALHTLHTLHCTRCTLGAAHYTHCTALHCTAHCV
jgi:hypothetical protein